LKQSVSTQEQTQLPQLEQTQTIGMERTIIFSPETLLALMQHYTEDCADRIPLDSEIVSLGVNAALQRMIGILVQSDSWEGGVSSGRDGKIGMLSPLHFRYEGGKVLLWGGKNQELAWTREENRFE
jgi:hypothetical protein